MKILHIFKDTNKKFYNPYIKFINKNFGNGNHYFYIENYSGDRIDNSYPKNIKYISNIEYINLILGLYKSEKIILHALMSPKLVLILFLQPWLLKKCNWVIWGGDLYYYQKPKYRYRKKIYEFMRAFCIKRFGGLITYTEGDYKLAKKWYGANGRWLKCFSYPSNLYKELPSGCGTKSNIKYVQVGNSADPSNNHKEILQKLEKFKEYDMEIICPLSYGDKEYALEIQNFGKNIFGDKFVALMEFMPIDEYLKILGKLDIVVFNHKRQQAMGNIRTLLGLGKKVYMRDDITPWESFRESGIKIYSFNNAEIDFDFSEEIRKKNIDRIKQTFSLDNLRKDWRKIFEN